MLLLVLPSKDYKCGFQGLFGNTLKISAMLSYWVLGFENFLLQTSWNRSSLHSASLTSIATLLCVNFFEGEREPNDEKTMFSLNWPALFNWLFPSKEMKTFRKWKLLPRLLNARTYVYYETVVYCSSYTVDILCQLHGYPTPNFAAAKAVRPN